MRCLKKTALACIMSVASLATFAQSQPVFRIVIPGIVPTPSGPTDPYYNSVTSLLPLNTSTGYPAVSDVKGNSWSSTDVALSGAQYKVGNGSLAFTASDSTAMGPPLSLPGDFTIEAWIYPTSNSPSWYEPVLAQWNQAGGGGGWIIAINSTGAWSFLWGPYSGSTPMLSGGSATPNQWTHLAITRQGDAFREFVNGSLVQTVTSSTAARASTVPVTLGNYLNVNGVFPASGVTNFSGYLQQVRITTGVARYTGSFTPSTSADPTQ